ncbi:hypothetical protein KJ807_05255, partial [Patescibacteria group bacterium]|nr:hypothetical protein [Patescibacteria group bacterium]MBU1939099.1 hypothetical protein [Patescibacteria group bacterium]
MSKIKQFLLFSGAVFLCATAIIIIISNVVSGQEEWPEGQGPAEDPWQGGQEEQEEQQWEDPWQGEQGEQEEEQVEDTWNGTDECADKCNDNKACTEDLCDHGRCIHIAMSDCGPELIVNEAVLKEIPEITMIDIESDEEDGESVLRFKGIREVDLLGFIPLKQKVRGKVSQEDGKIIDEIELPWWDLIATYPDPGESLDENNEAAEEILKNAKTKDCEGIREDVIGYKYKIKRNQYFQGKLLEEEDLQSEQSYLAAESQSKLLDEILKICPELIDTVNNAKNTLKNSRGVDVYKKLEIVDVRLFGFIPLEMEVEIMVNPLTGETSEYDKPWWGFLALEDEKEEVAEMGTCSGKDVCRTCISGEGKTVTECGTFYDCADRSKGQITCLTKEGLMVTDYPPYNKCKNLAKICDVCVDKKNKKYMECKSPSDMEPELEGATVGSCGGKDVCRTCLSPGGYQVTECGTFYECKDRAKSDLTCV